jgi:hypothetical protein
LDRRQQIEDRYGFGQQTVTVCGGGQIENIATDEDGLGAELGGPVGEVDPVPVRQTPIGYQQRISLLLQ